MNERSVEEIANAVLYEGYMLYPYRPSSVKNRQRWNFGVVYPKAYSESQNGSDSSFMQTECLVAGQGSASISMKVRFLQAVRRTIEKEDELRNVAPDETKKGVAPHFPFSPGLEDAGQPSQSWQEAVECEIIVPPFAVGDARCSHQSFSHFFPGGQEHEALRKNDGAVDGVIIRTKAPISANIAIDLTSLSSDLYKITVRIANASTHEDLGLKSGESSNREAALMHSLLSAHTILRVDGGEFISLLDAPEALKEIAAGCKNTGTWPVLAGEEGQRTSMLSSPIILYDYPQIAPESAGDLFDGTEIDEILALRILTLTEDEKKEMRETDERSRQILERTESMPPEHFMKLHGVLRSLRPVDEEQR